MPDSARFAAVIEHLWAESAIPTLVDYIRVPNKSPAFDPDWSAHGHMERAVALLEAWARSQIAHLPGARLEVVRLEGRTPVVLIEVPGAVDDTVLLYGHLDKQPEMTGWSEGLGPWTPVLREEKLYGRGGADDGYALFAALSALLALRDQEIAHARCVILIEACEESGSYDLPAYVEHLADRLGEPSLVVCLDSGCGNYDQLWLTTSLRGTTAGVLCVEVLDEGVHSGDASGVVPSSFRILRQLLSRLERESDGAILPTALHAPIPEERIAQAKIAAQALGEQIWSKFPFAGEMGPVATDPVELILNRTWRPQLAIIGMDGIPAPGNAGNVLRPYTAAKLSLRLPPTIDAEGAADLLKTLFESNPPYGARVTFTADKAGTGWSAPPLASWLATAVDRASQAAFGLGAAMMGEGGSIPFMAMLGRRFPKAQFVITGVLGPHSNAHGPNEFLHLPTARRISHAVAQVIADHANQVAEA